MYYVKDQLKWPPAKKIRGICGKRTFFIVPWCYESQERQ